MRLEVQSTDFLHRQIVLSEGNLANALNLFLFPCCQPAKSDQIFPQNQGGAQLKPCYPLHSTACQVTENTSDDHKHKQHVTEKGPACSTLHNFMCRSTNQRGTATDPSEKKTFLHLFQLTTKEFGPDATKNVLPCPTGQVIGLPARVWRRCSICKASHPPHVQTHCDCWDVVRCVGSCISKIRQSLLGQIFCNVLLRHSSRRRCLCIPRRIRGNGQFQFDTHERECVVVGSCVVDRSSVRKFHSCRHNGRNTNQRSTRHSRHQRTRRMYQYAGNASQQLVREWRIVQRYCRCSNEIQWCIVERMGVRHRSRGC